MTTIDMQTMRYINLLNRVTHVRTSKCFVYNNIIIFAVPSDMVARAIGPAGKNIRELQQMLGKKIKIIKEPKGIEDVQRFVADIVDPLSFKSLEVKDGDFLLTAGPQSKAALIGRNRRRLIELDQILKDNFGKELKII